MFDYLVRQKTSQQFTTNTLLGDTISPDHQNEAIKYQAKNCIMCKQSIVIYLQYLLRLKMEANTYTSNVSYQNGKCK